jgi:acyl-CoA synthetase (AMP-forming)/AMP-acid ligase II/thioesterase domain-containing protein/acyl carrier protein
MLGPTSSDPTSPTTALDLLTAAANAVPNGSAIMAPARQVLTYGRFLRHVQDMAKILRAAGVGPSDRVALVIPQGPELAVAFATVIASAVCAPMNATYRAREVEFFLTDLGVRALIAPRDIDSEAVGVAQGLGLTVLDLVPEEDAAGLFTLSTASEGEVSAPASVTADGTGLVLHTSGTTARPKIVPITQRSLCASARNIGRSLALGPEDRLLNVMPLFHIHGLMTLLASIGAGASVVCPSAFHVAEFFPWMDEFHPTWYTAVPTIHRAILGQAAANREVIARHPLRFIRSSSAPLPPRVANELEAAFGAPVLEAYGMTEAAHQIATNPLPPGTRKIGSVGVPTGTELAVLDDLHRAVPPGEIGEIVIRGPNVVGAYEKNPAANSEDFIDGWFRTGDQGRLDEEGYVFLTGRTKEIINRGGQKIAPREVDDVLVEHPAVVQAATFPVPHPTLGEDVAAAVVLRPGAAVSVDELRAFAQTRLTDYKVPSRVVLTEEIPKGPTGKVQRLALAGQLNLAGPRPPSSSARPLIPFESALAAIWTDVLQVDRVDADDNFFQLGGDSILAAVVVARMATQFGVRLPLRSVFERPSVRDLAVLVAGADGATDENDALVAIQRGGDRRPFFAGGSNPLYRQLAEHLGPDQPFYALDVYVLQEERVRRGLSPLGRIEDIAAYFVEKMRARQPHGPYLVGGACEGGVVAFEVAQQLTRVGQEVALLLIWETLAPKYYRHRALWRVVQQVRTLVESGAIFRLGPTGLAELAKHERIEYSIFRSVGRYTPQPYSGPVILIRAAEQPEHFRTATAGWEELVHGRLETRVVPGSHMTYFARHFREFADQVKACVQTAHHR